MGDPAYVNYIPENSFERGQCMRCKGMQVLDPSVVPSLIDLLKRCHDLISSEYSGSSLDNSEKIDTYIHLLESLPNL